MLLSIIMPVYMVEDYIEKSIQSIVHQTNRDFELILVNDGTKDKSIERAEKVLEDTGINYTIITQKNMGVSSARNTGIKLAKGDWIVCIDPDDCIHPQTFDFVQRVIEKENNEPEVIAFNYVMCKDQDYNYLMYEEFPDYDIFSTREAAKLYLDRKLRLITPAFFVQRKACIDKNFFYDPNVIYSEDTLYIWNVIANTRYIYYIDTPLYYYLIRPQSTMTSSNKSKILNGYRAYLEFERKMQKKVIFDEHIYILPRWVLGVMHSASRYMDLHDYRELLNALNYKEHITVLKGYHNKKVKMAAWMISILKSTSFFVLRIK